MDIIDDKVKAIRVELESADFTVNSTTIEGLSVVVANRHWPRLGISVRGRERQRGDHDKRFNLGTEDQLKGFERTCQVNGLTPWIAMYVRPSGDLYATSVSHYRAKYRKPEWRKPAWLMDRDSKLGYGQDGQVMYTNLLGSTEYPTNWFGRKSPA